MDCRAAGSRTTPHPCRDRACPVRRRRKKRHRGLLWVYKYSPMNEKPMCSIMEEPEYALLDPCSELDEAQINFYAIGQMLSIALRSVDERGVKIRCYYDMKTGDTINLNQ